METGTSGTQRLVSFTRSTPVKLERAAEWMSSHRKDHNWNISTRQQKLCKTKPRKTCNQTSLRYYNSTYV